jgi:hypothetical protein
MRNFKIIILIIFFGYSCSKDHNENIKPGYFIISHVDNNLKSANNNAFKTSNGDNSFDLGEIRKSEEYYFSLSNGGETPIFEVTLNCNNSAFTVSPESISVLEINENLNLLPSLKVRALHGKSLSGLGYTPLMDKGKNDCILSIKGKTLSGSDTIDVSLEVTLEVFALVSDLIVHNQNDTIDFYNYSYYGFGVFKDSCKTSGLDKIRAYAYSQNNYEITNTGNVPLIISIFNRLDSFDDNITLYSNYFTLEVGETSKYLNLPYCQNNFSYEVALKINSHGTICDINKLENGDDGNIYFALVNYCE